MNKLFDNYKKIISEQLELKIGGYMAEMYFDKDFMKTVEKKFPLENYTKKRFFRKNEIDCISRLQDMKLYLEEIAWMKAIHDY